MTDEQKERAARVWREALDAWDDASLAGHQADRAAIAVIAADRAELEAENARLREALQLIAGATTGVYIGPDAILDGVKRAARAALGASHDA